MSRPDAAGEVGRPAICEFCGFEIEEPDQQCPALDDGRCRP
jgi:rubrerythrin